MPPLVGERVQPFMTDVCHARTGAATAPARPPTHVEPPRRRRTDTSRAAGAEICFIVSGAPSCVRRHRRWFGETVIVLSTLSAGAVVGDVAACAGVREAAVRPCARGGRGRVPRTTD